MVGTIQEFKLDLRRFAEQVDVDLGQVRRKVSFDLFAGIVERTPVDTGRARGAWAMSDGAPAPVDPIGPDKQVGGAAAATQAYANITATFADPYGSTFIVNGLPYAQALEFGHSKQAPAGMVRASIAEVEAGLTGFTGPG